MSEQPRMRRRLAAAALHRYRQEAGLDGGDAARILGCDRSKITRIEAGERSVNGKDLERLMAEYGVPDAERPFLEALAGLRRPAGWWDAHGSLLPQEMLDYYCLEAAAPEVLAWAPWQLPAILQAPGYARAEAQADSVPPGLLDQAGEAAAARSQAIRDRGTPRVSVVLGEAALRRPLGGTVVARAQLLALASACEEGGDAPQFTIQVLPAGTVAHPGVAAGPASVLLFGPFPTPGLVHVPALHGPGLFLDDPVAVAGFSRAFAQLQSLALSREESARLAWQTART